MNFNLAHLSARRPTSASLSFKSSCGRRRRGGIPIKPHDLFCLHTAIDLKNNGGSLQKGPYSGKADVTFTVADQDFMEVVQGKLNPQKVQEALAAWLSCRSAVVFIFRM